MLRVPVGLIDPSSADFSRYLCMFVGSSALGNLRSKFLSSASRFNT